jgi:alkylated DNA repair dioxygenase AlkB
MIYSLGAKVLFQIRDPKNHADSEMLELLPNSLLLLTGKSRWNYEHSVIPTKMAGPAFALASSIHRISLVLGCKPLKV